MTEPYRPSNGTEGDIFMAKFCFNGCKHHTVQNPCMIMGRSLGYSIGDPEYPKEWVQDGYGDNERCTAYGHESVPDMVKRCDKTKDMFE